MAGSLPADASLGRRTGLRVERPLPPPARDYERLPTVLAGLHFVVFACLMLDQLLHLTSSA
jgi:hypothetical protein